MDELLRAGLWYLRGRDRDLLVDTGNGVGALAAVPRRGSRAAGGRARSSACARTRTSTTSAASTSSSGGCCTRPSRSSAARCATARRWRRRCWSEEILAQLAESGFVPPPVLVDAVPLPGLRPVHVQAGARRPDAPRAGRRRDRPRRPALHRGRPAGAHAGQHRAHRPRGARAHLRRRGLRRRADRHAARVRHRDVPAHDGVLRRLDVDVVYPGHGWPFDRATPAGDRRGATCARGAADARG